MLLCEIQARDEVVIESVDWQVQACRSCLQTLEPIWPGSKELKELLDDVASRAKEAMVPKTSGKKRKSFAYNDKDKERPISHPSQGHQSRSLTDSPVPHHAENQWQSQSVSPPEKDNACSKFLTAAHLQMRMSRPKVTKRIIQCIL